ALRSKERLVAAPGFQRWRILPAVLAIELCIGQVYAFSVFTLPLSRARGITASVPGDWPLTTLGWTFTLAMVGLGLSAAVGGTWVEAAGPRTSGGVAACCWGAGVGIAAAGGRSAQLPLVYLGYGVLGGCGLGLGYLTPLAPLLLWFPDRRGLALGLAIAGFSGGAVLGAPLAAALLQHFASPTSVGVAETFLVLGTGDGLVMLGGAWLFRLPPPGWQAPTPARTGAVRSGPPPPCGPQNNYPPAKPEVLRLLAPQRGLTAIAKSKPKPEKTTNGRLPELSNFGSPPAEPGVYHD